MADWRRHAWGQYSIDDPFWTTVSSKSVGFGNCWMKVTISTLLSHHGSLTLDYNHWIWAFFFNLLQGYVPGQLARDQNIQISEALNMGLASLRIWYCLTCIGIALAFSCISVWGVDVLTWFWPCFGNFLETIFEQVSIISLIWGDLQIICIHPQLTWWASIQSLPFDHFNLVKMDVDPHLS